MENTTENTNLRELTDVKEALPSGTSQQKRCQCHSNHRWRRTSESSKSTLLPDPKAPANCSFTPNPTVTKPSKSRSESSVHCCHAAVKTRQNVKEWSNKLNKNWTNPPDIREWRRLTCAEIICERRRHRHATISWGESVFLKRKSVSIRIIRQCLDVSRHFARDSHRDAVCKTNPDTCTG